MPTYEYKCKECGDVFETTHGIDDSVERCPGCGGKVRRLFHPVGIIFKGSGFYKTDNRSSSGNGGKKETPDKPAKVPEKSEKKDSDAEKKPAQKKEAGS
jgi:putative FmdB family regulatory protein